MLEDSANSFVSHFSRIKFFHGVIPIVRLIFHIISSIFAYLITSSYFSRLPNIRVNVISYILSCLVLLFQSEKSDKYVGKGLI